MPRQVWVTAIVVALGISGILAWQLAPASSSTNNPSAEAALSYAQQYMTWSRGPAIGSTTVAPIRQLDQELRARVPGFPRHDVDVAGLTRQYGPNHRVALVILRGTYDSLPPDEGVNITGDIVTLVDIPSDKVILITD